VRVLLDCDPGIDDAIAIFTLLRERVEVLGLCAVTGNVPVQRGFRNLRDLVALAGRGDLPVFRGAELPLLGDYTPDATVHGVDGLGGVQIPESTAPVQEEPAALASVRLLRDSPGPVTWIAIGPLTNLALALRLDSGIRAKIERIVVMGGSTTGGNMTPAAEFNVWVDPEAWRIVARAGLPLTMVGLNVTHQVAMQQEDFAVCEGLHSAVGRAAAGMLGFYRDVCAAHDWGAPKLHDVVAVLAAIHPELLQTRRWAVDVELGGLHTRGMTVVDERASAERATCDVAVDVASEAIRDRMLTALAHYRD